MHYLTFKSGLGLSRPSGLFLEPLESFGKEKKCYLYITSMHAAVRSLLLPEIQPCMNELITTTHGHTSMSSLHTYFNNLKLQRIRPLPQKA